MNLRKPWTEGFAVAPDDFPALSASREYSRRDCCGSQCECESSACECFSDEYELGASVSCDGACYEDDLRRLEDGWGESEDTSEEDDGGGGGDEDEDEDADEAWYKPTYVPTNVRRLVEKSTFSCLRMGETGVWALDLLRVCWKATGSVRVF